MKKHNSYQLAKISKSLKKVKNSEIRERLLLLKHYYQSISLREAAEHHQCSHGKVKYWKDRYEEQGLRGLQTQDKSGRPRKLNKEQATAIKRVVARQSNQQGWQTKQIKEYIEKKTGVTYSERHTIRIAQSWGLSQKKPRPQYSYAKEQEKQTFLKGKH